MGGGVGGDHIFIYCFDFPILGPGTGALGKTRRTYSGTPPKTSSGRSESSFEGCNLKVVDRMNSFLISKLARNSEIGPKMARKISDIWLRSGHILFGCYMIFQILFIWCSYIFISSFGGAGLYIHPCNEKWGRGLQTPRHVRTKQEKHGCSQTVKQYLNV